MEDFNKEAREMQDYLEISTSNDPVEYVERISRLMGFLARSGEMFARAKQVLRAKKTTEISKTILAIAKEQCLSASVQNALLDSICGDEAFMVDWLDRINRSCTHQLDSLRSLLSYEKEQMRFQP